MKIADAAYIRDREIGDHIVGNGSIVLFLGCGQFVCLALQTSFAQGCLCGSQPFFRLFANLVDHSRRRLAYNRHTRLIDEIPEMGSLYESSGRPSEACLSSWNRLLQQANPLFRVPGQQSLVLIQIVKSSRQGL